MTVISLTTIPSRFDKIGPTLETLLAQKADISEVRLYIPHHYKRFPDYDGTLPSVPRGVAIHRCETDFGPATKVLPAAKDLRGSGERLLFCDDDRLYDRDWAANLIDAGQRHPDRAICVIGWYLEKWLGQERKTSHDPGARHKPRWADWNYRCKRIAQQ
ncbi:glycosyltransferase family A protein, partial [Palleronia sp.]|uniref:glycosyltransferase family A protein n=1 Tax=Palleronia sp. TaxID=1940284 RepID=UPI0035C8493A